MACVILVIPICFAIDIELKKGQNFVSVPVENESIDNIMSGVSYNHLLYYNATTKQWQSSSPLKPAFLNTITSISWQQGFIVDALADANLTVDDDVTDYNYSLEYGWNMIGYPENSTQQAYSFFIENCINYSSLVSINKTTKQYFDALNVDAGYGYWINVTNMSCQYLPTQENQTILYVGTDQTYTTIQAAINDAPVNSIIYVYNGTYPFTGSHGADFTDKNNITLTGQNKDMVILEGDHTHTGILIENANNLKISNLTIRNGYQGIWINKSNNLEINNIEEFNATWEGIQVKLSYYVDILNSKFRNNTDNGIFIQNQSDNILIQDVETSNNIWHGISMIDSQNIETIDLISSLNNKSGLYSWNIDNILISGSIFFNNTYNGIDIINSNFITINNTESNNHNLNFTDINYGTAVQLWSCTHINIYNTSAINNYFGIMIYYSDYGKISKSYAQFNPKEYDGNAHGGIQIYRSSDFMIRNNIVKNNYAGIWSIESNNSIISDNIAQDNDFGIATYLTKNNNITGNTANFNDVGYVNDSNADIIEYENNFTFNNDCDIKSGMYGGTCIDLTSPSAITDLIAFSATGNKQIILNFTAVGDNGNYGSASSYIVKYYNESINDSNWNLATEYTQSWAPASNGTKESFIVTMPEYETYWFAIKAVDDYGLQSEISNPDEALAPYYSVTIQNITCYPVKDPRQECTYTLLSRTIYPYDTLSFNGSVTNFGNFAQNITTSLLGHLDEDNHSTDYYQINETILVNMTGKARDSGQVGGQYYSYNAQGVNQQYSSEQTLVYGIAANINLGWWSATDYPKPISQGTYNTDEGIWLFGNVFNNYVPVMTFDNVPLKLDINGSIHILNHPAYCQPNNLSCYVDPSNTSTAIAGWQVSFNETGDYNITMIAGHDPRDRPPILSRIIRIV